ncbi:heat- and acid-stable phosphoprotein [Quaeritorhiza haematococci]|nr:heat- and acid-stable phosphoprotein [Quaeritorhiza haematococci]
MPPKRDKKFNKAKRGGGKRFTPARVMRAGALDEEGLWGEPVEKEEQEKREGSETEDTDDDDESEEEGSEEESEEEETVKKPAKVQPVIQVANPNRSAKQNLKLSELSGGAEPREMSRREREAMEKARKQANYWKATMEGKTEEARADLARLAIIRKQREEAARKREEEAAAKSAKSSKSASLAANKGVISKSIGGKK